MSDVGSIIVPGDGELVLERPELALQPLVPLCEGQPVVDGVRDVVAVQSQVARGVTVSLQKKWKS